MTRKLAILGSALLLLIAATALAQPPVPGSGGHGSGGHGSGGPGFGGHGSGGPGFGGPGFGHLRELMPPPGYLNLSAAQQESARTLHEQIRTVVEAKIAEYRALRERLDAELEREHPDTNAIGRLALELHDFHDDNRHVIDDFVDQFRALLTPEQLVKWENFRELMRLYRQHQQSPGGRKARVPRRHWQLPE